MNYNINLISLTEAMSKFDLSRYKILIKASACDALQKVGRNYIVDSIKLEKYIQESN